MVQNLSPERLLDLSPTGNQCPPMSLYWQEIRLFREHAAERRIACLPAQFPELSRAPDDEGNEHFT